MARCIEQAELLEAHNLAAADEHVPAVQMGQVGDVLLALDAERASLLDQVCLGA